MQSLIPLSTPHTHTSKAKETSSGPEKQSQKAMRRKRGIYQVEGFFAKYRFQRSKIGKKQRNNKQHSKSSKKE